MLKYIDLCIVWAETKSHTCNNNYNKLTSKYDPDTHLYIWCRSIITIIISSDL